MSAHDPQLIDYALHVQAVFVVVDVDSACFGVDFRVALRRQMLIVR